MYGMEMGRKQYKQEPQAIVMERKTTVDCWND